LSGHRRGLGSSKGGYRAGFPLPESRVPWSLTKLFPRLRTDGGHLDRLSTVRPFVVIHSATGTVLCPFHILDYLVLDSFVGFVPIRVFYFSLCWCWALFFSFGFHLYLASRLFFGRVLFSLFPRLCDSFLFSRSFSS